LCRARGVFHFSSTASAANGANGGRGDWMSVRVLFAAHYLMANYVSGSRSFGSRPTAQLSDRDRRAGPSMGRPHCRIVKRTLLRLGCSDIRHPAIPCTRIRNRYFTHKRSTVSSRDRNTDPPVHARRQR
jgi:hypothetical protein